MIVDKHSLHLELLKATRVLQEEFDHCMYDGCMWKDYTSEHPKSFQREFEWIPKHNDLVSMWRRSITNIKCKRSIAGIRYKQSSFWFLSYNKVLSSWEVTSFYTYND
jgi:hypothetical protein